MSKANVEISLRRLAGYHICPGDKSALEYSRDAAAPVLRQIEAIFIAVRANLFRPDLPRSQRWFGARTLEDAVKIASLKPHRHDVECSACSQFDSVMSDVASFQIGSPERDPGEKCPDGRQVLVMTQRCGISETVSWNPL